MTVHGEEIPFFFPGAGEQLLGIVTAPAAPASTGVLIVVGGPQYRAGSHRQFVHLARHLAHAGVANMRFDYRGMGDSSGAMQSFEDIAPDVRAAVDAFFARAPWLRAVVLWGLCDAASAICFYASGDPRVAGVVLVNPWVRTTTGEARTRLRHYYIARAFDPAFWKKLIRGEFHAVRALSSLWRSVRTAFRPPAIAGESGEIREADRSRPLPERMAMGLTGFSGKILIVLSGKDYTAREFADAWAASTRWKEALRSARLEELSEADHTFSTRASKERLAALTVGWIYESSRERQPA